MPLAPTTNTAGLSVEEIVEDCPLVIVKDVGAANAAASGLVCTSGLGAPSADEFDVASIFNVAPLTVIVDTPWPLNVVASAAGIVTDTLLDTAIEVDVTAAGALKATFAGSDNAPIVADQHDNVN